MKRIRHFVSTTGINEQIIKSYIQGQAKEDAGQAKLELDDTAGVSP